MTLTDAEQDDLLGNNYVIGMIYASNSRSAMDNFGTTMSVVSGIPQTSRQPSTPVTERGQTCQMIATRDSEQNMMRGSFAVLATRVGSGLHSAMRHT